jgi:hypothetical protein
VVVEKILRDLPAVGKLFLLIRPKKGQAPDARLADEIIDRYAHTTWRPEPIAASDTGLKLAKHGDKATKHYSATARSDPPTTSASRTCLHPPRLHLHLRSEIFVRLRGEIGDEAFEALVREKLVAVGGDVLQDDAGLSEPDLERVLAETDIVVHSAASVAFDEPIGVAVANNCLGAQRVMGLAKKMRRLQAFVHVSTAYVHANHPSGSSIPERVNQLRFNAGEAYEAVLEVRGRGRGRGRGRVWVSVWVSVWVWVWGSGGRVGPACTLSQVGSRH